jgi:hypothetical protein|tara:strand:+ start:37 stop:174 length:138 start_codon:yes stop_codon:yes gene_type:complete
MAKQTAGGGYEGTSKIKHPGIHSKTKTSNTKTSKNYKKTYKGQGR